MKVIFVLLISLTFQLSAMPKTIISASQYQSKIDKNRAIEVAKEDAVRTYKSIEQFVIVVRETKKRWLINFELKDKGLNGGSPHYIISKKNGKILKARYYQ